MFKTETTMGPPHTNTVVTEFRATDDGVCSDGWMDGCNRQRHVPTTTETTTIAKQQKQQQLCLAPKRNRTTKEATTIWPCCRCCGGVSGVVRCVDEKPYHGFFGRAGAVLLVCLLFVLLLPLACLESASCRVVSLPSTTRPLRSGARRGVPAAFSVVRDG
mmetsp:Transcript_52129/g.107019  ORF Transcript_52129/g.107019 Transcript_52129/m.107019 type:complete len:160 (-) Transcript_52129:679-1158(-)